MREIATVHAEPQQVTDTPVYRVNFWQQPPPGFGWPLDAYALVDARDVHEVISWAEERSEGRKIEIFVEVDQEPEGEFSAPRKTDLIRLAGCNPNEGVSVEIGRFVPGEPS